METLRAIFHGSWTKTALMIKRLIMLLLNVSRLFILSAEC